MNNFIRFLRRCSTRSVSRIGAVLGTTYVLYKIGRNETDFVNITHADRKEYVLKERIPYLIIGSGVCGQQTASNIAKYDTKAKIVLLTKETHPFYQRMSISNTLWNIDDTTESFDDNLKRKQSHNINAHLCVDLENLFDTQDIPSMSVLGESKVTYLDTDLREVTLSDGRILKFDKLVLATGISPLYSDIFADASEDIKSKIMNYFTIEDFFQLRDLVVSSNKSIVILDDGLLGCELSSSLKNDIYSKYNNKVHLISNRKGVLLDLLPSYFRNYIEKKLSKSGVNIVKNSSIKSFSQKDDKICLHFDGDLTIEADVVVDCSNYRTNVDFAQGNSCRGRACPKLEALPDGTIGYKTNPYLQSGGKDIYVGGDAAIIFDVVEDKNRQIGHFINAIDSSNVIANNITSTKLSAYNAQKIFWTDIGNDIKLDIVGNVNSSMNVHSYWTENVSDEEIQKDYKGINNFDDFLDRNNDTKGVLFYCGEDDIIEGILTYNIRNPIGLLEKIVRGQIHIHEGKELAKLIFQQE